MEGKTMQAPSAMDYVERGLREGGAAWKDKGFR